MNAGRELDALIAEKVMGVQAGPEYYWQFSDKIEITGGFPKYSTDIAAAWEVVEKMRGDGFNLTLAITSTQVLGRFYTPENKVMWDSSPVFKGGIPMDTVALTAPHAICLAALRAVGFNSDELKTKETL